MSRFGSEDQARYYLSAMIDGEGSVSPRDFRVRIANTELSIIEAIEDACAMLDIETKRHNNGARPASFGTKDVYEILISRRYNMERLAQVVDLQSADKRAKLTSTIGSYKRGHQRRGAAPKPQAKKPSKNGNKAH